MRDSCSGLRDKLYWRQVGSIWHCFKKVRNGLFQSLCDYHTLPKSYGGRLNRPPVLLRCGLCDGEEINRRGHDESLPKSAYWTGDWSGSATDRSPDADVTK